MNEKTLEKPRDPIEVSEQIRAEQRGFWDFVILSDDQRSFRVGAKYHR